MVPGKSCLLLFLSFYFLFVRLTYDDPSNDAPNMLDTQPLLD